MENNLKELETLIDLTNLKELINGQEEMIKPFLNKFVNNASQLIQKINIFLPHQNYKEIAKIAHQLKPIIDFFEITALKKDIRTIENICKNAENASSLVDLIAKLNIKMTDIFEKINKLP